MLSIARVVFRGDFFSFMTMCKKIMQKKVGDIKKKQPSSSTVVHSNGGDTDFQDKSFTNFLWFRFTTLKYTKAKT